MDRIVPGVIALVVGAFAAVLLLVPFVAIASRRRGGLSAAHGLAWLALLFWIMGLWAYTLLPLPAEGYACVGVELDPTQVVRDAAAGGVGGAAMQQLLLNVLLFAPWGFLVRALWRRGWAVAGASGLLISLAVEFTQLTGVWGLYPCAYRLFDTGDLLANTVGAMAGSLLAVLFLRHRRATPEVEVAEVTTGRRLLGMLCDAVVATLLTAVVIIAIEVLERYGLGVPADDGTSRPLGAAVVFLVLGALVLATGTTPGESAVRLEGVDGRHPAVAWRGVRFLVGVGGFQLLGLVPGGWSWLPLGAFVIVSAIVAVRSVGHRGLAAMAGGMTVRLGGAAQGVASPGAR